jgi:hypothetical protein
VAKVAAAKAAAAAAAADDAGIGSPGEIDVKTVRKAAKTVAKRAVSKTGAKSASARKKAAA